MALCLNESEVTKAIKTVKVLCGEAQSLCACTIREAEAHCMVLVREAKTHHVTCIKEAEANCVTPWQEQRTTAPLLSGRQSPEVPHRPTGSNSHMPRTYNT